MRYIRITKIESITEDKEKANLKLRPIGRFDEGIEYTRPYIGGNYNLYPLDRTTEHKRGISTSQVTEIIDEYTFKTYYSIYKIEEILQP